MDSVFLARSSASRSHSRNSQVTVLSQVYERKVPCMVFRPYLFSCLLLCKQQEQNMFIPQNHHRFAQASTAVTYLLVVTFVVTLS